MERSLTEFRIAEYVPGRGRRVSMEDSLLEDKSEDSQSEEEEEEDYLSRYLDLHRKEHIVSSIIVQTGLHRLFMYMFCNLSKLKKKSSFIITSL